MTAFAFVCLILLIATALWAYALHLGNRRLSTRNLYLVKEVLRLEDVADCLGDELDRARKPTPPGIVKTAMRKPTRAKRA